MRAIWLATAEQQLDEIFDFLANQNERVAVNIYNDIIDEADRLCSNPETLKLKTNE
jgi:plasmid stabilization system protein ParE